MILMLPPSGSDNSTRIETKPKLRGAKGAVLLLPTCLINLCLDLQLQVNVLQRGHGHAIGDDPQVGMGVQVREQT